MDGQLLNAFIPQARFAGGVRFGSRACDDAAIRRLLRTPCRAGSAYPCSASRAI
jgi:hypothetical protein